MKFLGTIIKVTGDNFLSLIDFPVAIAGLKVPAGILVGYSEGTGQKYGISEFKLSRKRLNVKIGQSLSREQLFKFKEMGVFIDEYHIIFEDDEESYFISDLIGCKVITEDTSEELGEIVDVYTMPANDVWVVRTKDGNLPIPAVKEYIIDIDLDNGIVIVKLLEGLTDLIEPI